MSQEAIPKRMLAAVLMGPDRLAVGEVETPRPGFAEVLIRVEACALCGSDVSLIHEPWAGQPPYGEFVPGHEYAGTVAALGDTVDEVHLGQRVAVEAHLGCLRCLNCRRGDYTACLNYGNRDKGHRANGFTSNGGYAQYVVNHVNTVHPVADWVGFEEASLLTNAGCALYGLETLGSPVAGQTVAVIGPGPVGLVTVEVLKALGAGRVILVGTRRERLDLGRRLGADLTVLTGEADPAAVVSRETGGRGADVVIDCSGSPRAPQQAVAMVKRMGKILLLSIPHGRSEVDLGRVVKDNVEIYSVRGEGRANCRRAVSLLDTGRLDLKPIVTHTFPLHQIHRALETFVDRSTGAIKVVVKPNA
jgi:L-iditol 2-dehydrogenase